MGWMLVSWAMVAAKLRVDRLEVRNMMARFERIMFAMVRNMMVLIGIKEVGGDLADLVVLVELARGVLVPDDLCNLEFLVPNEGAGHFTGWDKDWTKMEVMDRPIMMEAMMDLEAMMEMEAMMVG